MLRDGECFRHRIGGGALPEDDRTCALSTNDFLARGGDRSAMFGAAQRRIDARDGSVMAVRAMEFVESAGAAPPAAEGRIVHLD